MPQIFTRAEAEMLLPQLAPPLRDLQVLWGELVDATTASAMLRQRMIGDGHIHFDEMTALTQRVEVKRQQVAELVSRIRAFGCELKDPRIGLIDFPSQMFGRVVYLCWRLGEPRISWWHDLDGGFQGRQPID